MSDHATPNLPSRDFDRTLAFYRSIGFELIHRDEHWMILTRGALTLEFFPHPKLEPLESWFSCCLRVDDVDALLIACENAAIPEMATGYPRLHRPTMQPFGLRMGALIDCDGSLLRLIANARA